MYIKIIIRVLFIFTLFHGYSQTSNSLGINIGGNLSKFRGNDLIESHHAITNFLFGLSYENKLNDKFSLVLDLNYTKKGYYVSDIVLYNADGQLISDNEKITICYNYMELPILFKYEINQSNFFINGGGFFGYLLNTNMDDKQESLDNKIDSGISFGIGYKLMQNDKNSINIEIRDNLGLINISKVEVMNNGTNKTNSLNLLLKWNIFM